MFGTTRWSPFEDLFNVQREVDRLFTRAWGDLPSRGVNTSAPIAQNLNVRSDDQGWRVDVPLPGIDPRQVTLDVAGQALHIRAERSAEEPAAPALRYEQTFMLPPFLDVDRISATHRHGLLQIAVPFKESVKPRRIAIATDAEQKQLTAA